MRDEIQQSAVDSKGSEAPLGKQSECKSCDAADNSQRRRAPAGANAGGETQECWRKDERVQTLPGNPEKDEIANRSANRGAQQPECDYLRSSVFRHGWVKLNAAIVVVGFIACAKSTCDSPDGMH